MAASTAHTKIITLLAGISPDPSPVWNVYDTHEKANLVIPALSVEVDSDTPLKNEDAINEQELVDNREYILSIRIHTSYKLGAVKTVDNALIVDDVIRILRENIDLTDGYWIFDVLGAVFNVELTSSGTSGAEIKLSIHKVEFYAQS